MVPIGTVIDGKYKILNQIGQGGMSVVYLAMNEKANKTWAVKEVRRDGILDDQVIRQGLLRETELLKKLRHPNLPSIIDVIDGDGAFFIVMDYIEGISLEARLLDQGPQTQEDVISWGKQLCGVLGYLHRLDPPIIYRDMKPSNVMLKSDGSVTLIDFGTAREFREHSRQDDTVCLGTPGYAAPEQWGGCGQTDARTDIYCLGASLYHLLTGQNPSEPPYEMVPLRQVNSALSGGLEAILAKCTQKDPEERYQSCEELLFALEHYNEQDVQYRKTQKRRLGIFAATAALSLVLGIGAITAYSMERRLITNTYEALLAGAQSEQTKEKQVEACRKAIALEPGKALAYEELLNQIFLTTEEGVVNLDAGEDEILRGILNSVTGSGQTYEGVLKEQREEYDRLAYQLGLAYYYYYEQEGNKAYAVKWLRTAAASGILPAQQVERAKRLGIIAGYYSEIGSLNKAGDASVSYLDYWRDLTALSKGNLVELDNVVTALRMYQEVACQIYTRTRELKNSGVEQQELEAELFYIKQKLATEVAEADPEAQGLGEMVEKLETLLKDAGTQVEAAYGYQSQQEGEGI